MTVGIPITASNAVTYQPSIAAPPTEGSSDLTFGEVLSDLNPLQYLPVVGTIYRAITGDVIPKPLREAGSLVVSGLLGGPAGVAMNLAMLALEKITGIDLEDVEQSVLGALSPAKDPQPTSALAQNAAPATPSGPTPSGPTSSGLTPSCPTSDTLASDTALPAATTRPAVSAPISQTAAQPALPAVAAQPGPWTPAQLAAYGVIKRADGNLQQGSLSGADVLNALQLRAMAGATIS
jgi:hypothetical protein